VVLIAVRTGIYSHSMARVASLVVVACAVLITACTAARAPLADGTGTPAQRNGSTVQAGGPASSRPVPGAAYASGGCGATPLLLGSAPRWASSANPPPIRYAHAERGQVAGFMFGYPLMAGNPQPYSDKILWVVASPPGRDAAAAERSSALCRQARCVIDLASGSVARRDLSLRHRSPCPRLLAVHPVTERAHGHYRPLVRQAPVTTAKPAHGPDRRPGLHVPQTTRSGGTRIMVPARTWNLLRPWTQRPSLRPGMRHVSATVHASKGTE
jgi:hypothetical protein